MALLKEAFRVLKVDPIFTIAGNPVKKKPNLHSSDRTNRVLWPCVNLEKVVAGNYISETHEQTGMFFPHKHNPIRTWA